MYKLLLCLRYLRTRWIALASVVSVTLGVATLIVVNSVMGGFATEMRSRVLGVLAHIMVKGGGHNGFLDSELYIQQIQQELGDKIEAVTPVIETLGLLGFTIRGETIQERVKIIGVDPHMFGHVGKWTEYLVDEHNRENPSFDIRDHVRQTMEPWRTIDADPDLDDVNPQSSSRNDRTAVRPASVVLGKLQEEIVPSDFSEITTPVSRPTVGQASHPDPFEGDTKQSAREGTFGGHSHSLLGPEAETIPKERGIIVPWLLATFRAKGQDFEVIRPGHQVVLTLPSASATSMKIEGRYARFTVVDRFKSGMSEYDQTNCYVDLHDLQEITGMIGRVSSIQIKLKNYADAPAVVAKLETIFPARFFHVQTWEQEQGPLLSAVAVEQGILNILLFMIIAVAGFGILAIFFMIVVEKTRDIGILKSLGASDGGVMQIFLAYGLALGLVGSGLGMAIGLLIVIYLDRIEKWLSWITGHDIFSRDLYYFDKIPTAINAFSIAWIVAGAMLIAVAASVLPARRAAGLRPVQALRYE